MKVGARRLQGMPFAREEDEGLGDVDRAQADAFGPAYGLALAVELQHDVVVRDARAGLGRRCAGGRAGQIALTRRGAEARRSRPGRHPGEPFSA
jgi:hypothetical protein